LQSKSSEGNDRLAVKRKHLSTARTADEIIEEQHSSDTSELWILSVVLLTSVTWAVRLSWLENAFSCLP